MNVCNINSVSSHIGKNDIQLHEISELYSCFSTDSVIPLDEKGIIFFLFIKL